MKNKTIIFFLFGVIFWGILCTKGRTIFDYNIHIFDPYISGIAREGQDDMGREYEGFQENGVDYINYYSQATKAIGKILDYKATGEKILLKEATEIVDNLYATFERYGRFPRPVYKNFKYGWVSSMDAPTVMVASEMLYEVTNKEQYKVFVKSLSKYVTKSNMSGGYNLYSDGIEEKTFVWPMEYINQETTYEDAQWVLNGSLVGYLGVQIIADLYQDEDLLLYLENVRDTYRNMFEKFHYAKYPWSFYMLNPKTVIPPHYIIFEKQLLESMYEITPDPIFIEEIRYRETALKSVLKPQFQKMNDKILFIMRRACAPHPYLLDVYGTKIEFQDQDNNIINTYENSLSGICGEDTDKFKKGEFLTGVVNTNAMTYTVYAIKGGIEEELFSGTIEFNNNINDPVVDYDIDISYDIHQINSSIFEISSNLSDKGEARITYELLPGEFKHSLNTYWGIEINNLSSHSSNMGAILYDSEGTGVTRYYTKLLPGKNLVLLSEIGFSEIDRLKDIKKISLRIFTAENSSNYLLEIGPLYRFTDMFNLKEYMYSNNIFISPQ